MKKIKRSKGHQKTKGRKGAALVATLFVIMFVFVLGLAFILMSLSDSRSGVDDRAQLLSLQMANSGFELLLNYLSSVNYSASGAAGSVWRQPDYANWSISGTEAQKAYQSCLTLYPTTANSFRSSYIESGEAISFYVKPKTGSHPYISSTGTGYPYGYLSYSITITPARNLGDDLVGDVEIDLIQVYPGGGQPCLYTASCKGRVFRGSATGNPIASRTIEAKFRQSQALEWLHFVQNHRAFDIPGVMAAPPCPASGVTDNTGAAANDGTQDGAYIPADYKSKGDICIDGGSDFGTDTSGNMRVPFPTPPPAPASPGVKFYGQLKINQAANTLDGTTNVANNSGIYENPVMASQQSLGIPRKWGFMNYDSDVNGTVSSAEEGRACTLAKDTTGGYAQAYFECGQNQGFATNGTGRIGHSVAPTPAKWYKSGESVGGVTGYNPYGMTAAKYNASYDNMAVAVPADVEFDGTMSNPSPGFCKWVVTLGVNGSSQGTVTVTKTTAYTNQTVTVLATTLASNIKNGVMYFDGGNVEVKGTLQGKLTIVASEHGTREANAYKITHFDNTVQTQYNDVYKNQSGDGGTVPAAYDIPGKFTHTTVDLNKRIKQVIQQYSKATTFNTANGDWNSRYLYVPYDDKTRVPVNVDGSNNIIWNADMTPQIKQIGPYFVDSTSGNGRWAFYGEPTVNKTIRNYTQTTGNKTVGVFRDGEREGNLIIGGNIAYQGDGSSLGLVAKNYILLNDDNVGASGTPPDLSVRGALVSFDHSIQFDDINMAGKSSWRSESNMNGKFIFRGSILGQFADVEGCVSTTVPADNLKGYPKQEMYHDPNLMWVLPPHFPSWTLEDMMARSNWQTIVLDYIVLSYQDKGAVSASPLP